ncbi:hypothetical protein [Bacillus sp. 166amftsu]|nr:hypothetical protein [Bacillus sp. 166amftsu]SDY95326.1 hypothetical protein SAMN04488156_103192 [Bacillus sp. 166amftsu]
MKATGMNRKVDEVCLSRPKSKKYLKYQAPNILYMTNMLGAFIFGNEF